MTNLLENHPGATLALPVEEQTELARLESVIERGKETFIEVGTALCRIRDARLYRATNGSFQCYCEARWNFSRVQAHRLIEAANVVALLPIGNTSQITNEAQARALARVPEELRVEVLEAAVKSGKPITAKTITESSVEVIPPPPASEADWLPDERERQALVLSGKTVVANLTRDHNSIARDHNLIAWAQSKGLYTRVDRRTDFGNPFEMPGDGDRDEVCDKFSKLYLPAKPSLLKRIPELRGRVLGCWCYPLRCHGDDPAARANERGEVV